jgi:hypothetical protein
MSQPVWTLSVDLQTRTATFQSGMSDAAKAARGSFNEIKAGADEMGRATGGSMMEARHGVMLLGEEFGVHLPRGVTMFISSLGPVAGAMSAAFPFLALAVGAKVLLDHLSKVEESGAKVSAAWRKVSDVGAEAMEHMQEKLTTAEIRADELAGNHLAALEKKLQQIDHATLRDVISEIDKMGAAADVAFKQSEHGWFMQLLMGHADLGPAKTQLDGYISKIDELKNSNAKPEDVLSLVKVDVADVRSKMATIWNLMQQYQAQKDAALQAGDDVSAQGADIALGKAKEQWDAQQKILDIMTQQQNVAATGAKAANVEKGNDRTEETNRITEASKKLAQENTEIAVTYGKLMQSVLAYHRAQSEGHGEQSGAEALRETLRTYSGIVAAAKESAQARLSADRKATAGEMELAKAQMESELSAIQNAKRAGLLSKAEALRQEIALEDQARDRKISDIRQAAQEQVAAYQTEIAAAQKADAAQSALGVKRGDPGYINYLEQINTPQSKVDATTVKAANDEQIAVVQTQTKIAGLVSTLQSTQALWSQYFAKMKADTSDVGSAIRINLQSSMTSFEQGFGNAIAKSLVEGKSLMAGMRNVAKDIAEGMISSTIKMATQWATSHVAMLAISHATAAQQLAVGKATASQLAGANGVASMAAAPWPVDMGAPAFGASMMAAAMAFDTGGIVPGVGGIDTVPAMLTPGEAILPRRMTENLTNAAQGSSKSGPDIHIHYSPTQHIQALDSDGVDKVLTQHKETFHRHFDDHVRRMNQ